MLNILRVIISFLGIITLMSCASGYTKIKPDQVNFSSYSNTDSVSLEYQYASLPKKYAKKEDTYNVRLLSVRIKNNSGRDLTFGKNLNLAYNNGSKVQLVDNKTAYSFLSQSSGGYLLYLALTPLKLVTGSQVTGEVNVTPIGYFIGPGLALFNFLTASSSNKVFRNELETYNIVGKTIPNGGSLNGIVAIKSSTYDGLQLDIRN